MYKVLVQYTTKIVSVGYDQQSKETFGWVNRFCLPRYCYYNRIYKSLILTVKCFAQPGWILVVTFMMIINFSKIIKVNAMFNFELIVSIITNLLFVIMDEIFCHGIF
jgi:hypothetical protein